MDVEKKDLEGNKVELNVNVNSEKVDKALENAYKKVVKDVNIPGFRKGKVPRKVLEAKFGKEVLHQDALEFLIPEAYMEAVKETGIKPIAQPQIDDYYLAESEPATFKATVEVRPEVELGQYTGLGIEQEEVEVAEEEIEGQLKRMQDQYSTLQNTDREEVEEGDYVTIDFEGEQDGQPFPGGSAEEYSLEIGGGQFIPGFEEKLIGHKVDEEVEFDITFPEDYQAPDLAGETVTFTVDIKEIKEKTVPDLDDDFAKEASEFDTLEELEENIRENLYSQKEQQARQQYEDELINTVAANAEVEISDTMIEQELDRMYQEISQRISSQGMDIEDYLQYQGLDKESWREENREAAANRARSHLVLREIMKEEEINVSDDEIDEYFEEIAENQEDSSPEELKERFENNNQMSYIRENLKMQKTVDFLKENN